MFVVVKLEKSDLRDFLKDFDLNAQILSSFFANECKGINGKVLYIPEKISEYQFNKLERLCASTQTDFFNNCINHSSFLDSISKMYNLTDEVFFIESHLLLEKINQKFIETILMFTKKYSMDGIVLANIENISSELYFRFNKQDPKILIDKNGDQNYSKCFMLTKLNDVNNFESVIDGDPLFKNWAAGCLYLSFLGAKIGLGTVF